MCGWIHPATPVTTFELLQFKQHLHLLVDWLDIKPALAFSASLQNTCLKSLHGEHSTTVEERDKFPWHSYHRRITRCSI